MFVIDGVKVGSILVEEEPEPETPTPEPAKATGSKAPAADKGAP